MTEAQLQNIIGIYQQRLADEQLVSARLSVQLDAAQAELAEARAALDGAPSEAAA